MSAETGSWIATKERRQDWISPAPANALAATLDLEGRTFQPGDALPPLWHWLYFLETTGQSELGPDGHASRGGFLPPVSFAKRLYAGNRLTFHEDVVIGGEAEIENEVVNVEAKDGRAGPMTLVTVSHKISQDGKLCVGEECDIMFVDNTAPIPEPQADQQSAAPKAAWTRRIDPDPILLFRFSSLTFNSHRIHYDRDYATKQEGYPGLIVHGPLTALLLIELVRENSDRKVRSYSFRATAPLFDLGHFYLAGDPDEAGADLRAVTPGGTVALEARAEFLITD